MAARRSTCARRVHEYGGGAYLVSAGTVYFCNDADQRLYRQEHGAAPAPITPEPGRPRGLRYADGVMDAGRGRMIWVREDHTTGAREPVNTLVEIPLDGSRPQRILQAGRDFYAAPRLSPDGAGSPGSNGTIRACRGSAANCGSARSPRTARVGRKRRVAGGDDKSVFQPEWSPDGGLYFVSDRAQAGLDGRWWNLFRARGDRCRVVGDRAGLSAGGRVRPAAMEFPHVDLCLRDGAKAGLQLRGERRASAGRGRSRFDGGRPIATTYQDISSVRAAGGRLYFRGGSPTEPPAIVELDLGIRPHDRAASARPPRISKPIAAICRRRSR